MIRATILLAVLAGPALAQDADPQGQLVEGYLSCFMGRADPDVVAPNLGLYGWTHEPAEDGLVIALPGAGEATFVLIAEDKSFCHVESLALGSDKAAEFWHWPSPGPASPCQNPPQTRWVVPYTTLAPASLPP